MPERIGPIQPFFIVANLARAVDFYTERLAFEVRYSGPEGDPFFAIVGRDSVQLHLKEISLDVHPQPNSTRHKWAPWDAFVYTENPGSLAEEFTGRGLKLHTDLEVTGEGLSGFAVQDSDGYVLFFGRPAA